MLTNREHDEFQDLSNPFRALRDEVRALIRKVDAMPGDAARDLSKQIEGAMHDADAFSALDMFDRCWSDDEQREALDILRAGVPGCAQPMGRAA